MLMERPAIDIWANDISHQVWETKYRYVDRAIQERTPADTWRRVAHALAAVEAKDRPGWEERYFSILREFKFLPGGRIQAGAGTARTVTLFNCFVMGVIEDSISGIFQALQEGAITLQQGGGIGLDFSTLRPRGTRARGAGSIASGPASFMQLWDATSAILLSTGARRAAMMATLRCDHPDIEEFIVAKQQAGQLRRFNLSVLVTDEFMQAVRRDSEWPLIFPESALEGNGETVMREWSGASGAVPCRVIQRIRARHLWDLILGATYDYAEPGVLFIDRINRLNNLWYRERISATNPCGEVPLPPYGACDLGSLNLTRFVVSPFTPQARLNTEALAHTTNIAVRLLDNVIDSSHFPLPQQSENARGARRIGLGITGLADSLVMLNLTYGSAASLALAAEVMRVICHNAYRASIALARERGSFPFFEREKYTDGPFIRSLPEDIQADIAAHGIRNSHLIAIAPTGSISLLAGNVSSGLEPIFAACHTRNVLDAEGHAKAFVLTDYAVDLWRRTVGTSIGMPEAFVTVATLPMRAHLDMQAALQPFVDNSISKTINVPESCPFSEFRRIYDLAYDKGLKGCTTFRPNPVTGTVIGEEVMSAEGPDCCVPEREPD